jgi:hypothetical protein
MLRVLGGAEIQLVVSASAASNEDSRELGLGVGESRQFAVSPVVVNWLATKPGTRAQAELLIGAGSLRDALEATGVSSGKELLEDALAIIVGEKRLRIAAVQVGAAGGTDYLYTVTAVV